MSAPTSTLRRGPALLCLAVAVSPSCWAESLSRQLQNLAQTHQFRLEGLDRLNREPGRSVDGDVREQVQELLSDYNYVLIQGAGGRIERVSITSLKDPSAKPRFSPVVATTRYGSHHQVQARVTGPSGQAAEVTLLVDTGATTLVLPESMIETLGFDPASLRPAVSQTASDTVNIRIGTLASVQVGQVVAENVDVSFFPDQRLNGAMLLGMSFLNRYRFSLDDENSELTLIAK
jgi:aspartyl protease family protein